MIRGRSRRKHRRRNASACSSSGWPNNTFGFGRLDVLAAVQQTEGTLHGVVSEDATGQGIVGASVLATDESGGSSFGTISGAGGVYTLTLAVGTYTVTASAPCYAPFSAGGVSITGNLTTSLGISLTPSCLPNVFLPLVAK